MLGRVYDALVLLTVISSSPVPRPHGKRRYHFIGRLHTLVDLKSVVCWVPDL